MIAEIVSISLCFHDPFTPVVEQKMLISFGRVAEVFTPALLCQESAKLENRGQTLHLSMTWSS